MTMLFDEVLLDPDAFSFGAGETAAMAGGPEYANKRIFNKQTGVYKTNVARFDAVEMLAADPSLMKAADLEYLTTFIRGGYGSGVGFRLKVPHDYTIESQALAETDGVEWAFPLKKFYSRPGGSLVYDRRIVKPVVQPEAETNGVVLLDPNGADNRVINVPFQVSHEKGGGSDPSPVLSGWTVDCTRGVLFFEEPPEAGTLYITCEFDIPAAFVGNQFTSRMDVIGEAKGLSIREVLPAELGIFD